jgi:hypothetical protein
MLDVLFSHKKQDARDRTTHRQPQHDPCAVAKYSSIASGMRQRTLWIISCLARVCRRPAKIGPRIRSRRARLVSGASCENSHLRFSAAHCRAFGGQASAPRVPTATVPAMGSAAFGAGAGKSEEPLRLDARHPDRRFGWVVRSAITLPADGWIDFTSCRVQSLRHVPWRRRRYP